jgi:murein L,D-transpeptidase YafK
MIATTLVSAILLAGCGERPRAPVNGQRAAGRDRAPEIAANPTPGPGNSSLNESAEIRPLRGSIRIVIRKGQRQLLVYSGTKLLRTYPVGLGFNPLSDKFKEGDGATPDGEFYIFTKNAESKYLLSLGISYPNREDAERGLKSGLIAQTQYQQIVRAIRAGKMPPQDTPLGGQICIHGRGSNRDWTWGCIALDDPNIRELFRAVRVGTKVTIEP